MTTDDRVVVRLPDGAWRSADTVDDVLPQLLGREVAMSDRRTAGAPPWSARTPNSS